ncbi:MAG TPA: glycoside hydrolase domain-containing protein [Candidatus Solibacter sp.]|nr:glycoside hydrolase domain-containing protein [Candidatus Solibacter sp.]
MKRIWLVGIAVAAHLVPVLIPAQPVPSYLGFDRNEYPGNSTLKTLRQTFSYTGYWLNNPPGASANSWAGHRADVEAAGFGFLVLFNGRLYAELKSVANARRFGQADAQAAASAARSEGFPAKTIIFLDQEQGGRMLPEQKAYIYAWVDAVTAAGFRAGVYCSGIPAADDANVVTAVDVHEHAGEGARATSRGGAARDITYWAINDACPPSPGCSYPKGPPKPSESAVNFAEVWQFAQSPRRKGVAAHCTNYSRDGNCYAPGLPGVFVDLNAATSADPSHARTR